MATTALPTMSGDRVKAARELLGLSQEELADAANLSQGLISQLECGNRTVTETVLRAVVQGTGVPWSFFARTPTDLATDSLRFRKYRSASRRATIRVRRTFVELFDVVDQLMEWAHQPTPQLPKVSAQRQLSVDLIEDLANEARNTLHIDPVEPIRHMTRTLERASIPVAPIVFTDLDGDEVDEVAALGHFGLSARMPATGRAVIAYFPSSGDRQRFTLAHELGHLILHSRLGSQAENAEEEADRFAGALLLPREVAAEVFSERLTLREFARLKAEWGVSIQALVMRARLVRAIDEQRRVSLFKQISARGWRRNEPVIVRNEDPALLGVLLSHRFHRSRNTYTNAASEVGLPAVLLRAIMPQPRDAPSGTQPEQGAKVVPLSS